MSFERPSIGKRSLSSSGVMDVDSVKRVRLVNEESATDSQPPTINAFPFAETRSNIDSNNQQSFTTNNRNNTTPTTTFTFPDFTSFSSSNNAAQQSSLFPNTTSTSTSSFDPNFSFSSTRNDSMSTKKRFFDASATPNDERDEFSFQFSDRNADNKRMKRFNFGESLPMHSSIARKRRRETSAAAAFGGQSRASASVAHSQSSRRARHLFSPRLINMNNDNNNNDDDDDNDSLTSNVNALQTLNVWRANRSVTPHPQHNVSTLLRSGARLNLSELMPFIDAADRQSLPFSNAGQSAWTLTLIGDQQHGDGTRQFFELLPRASRLTLVRCESIDAMYTGIDRHNGNNNNNDNDNDQRKTSFNDNNNNNQHSMQLLATVDNQSPEFELYKHQLLARAADFSTLNIVADDFTNDNNYNYYNDDDDNNNETAMTDDDTTTTTTPTNNNNNNTSLPPPTRITAHYGALASPPMPAPLRRSLWPSAMAFNHSTAEMIVFFAANRAAFGLHLLASNLTTR
jgi:hypothetical protein